IAAAGEWEIVGGGVPKGGYIDGDFNAHAVQNLSGDDTIQRLDNGDTNTKADWTADNATETFGVLNVGQTAL
ncbi:MAG: hypothetical protein AAGC55_30705, partial [Myxococcota bacterium]